MYYLNNLQSECILYNQGFCPFGPNCLREHKKKPKSALPSISDILKKIKPMVDKTLSVIKPAAVYLLIILANQK